MTKEQYKHGMSKLKHIAETWGVPESTAARILISNEAREFWNWVNADEFLCRYAKENKT